MISHTRQMCLDKVQVRVLTSPGTNNANFATPVDGSSGRMRMYIWTTANPKRDGDLEAGIVIHEYTHGCKYPPFCLYIPSL